MNEMALSIVAPCYNEAAGLREFYRRAVNAATESVGCSYEFILVDDGSRDETWQVIEELAHRDHRVTGLRLTRNFGHQAAVTAGLAICAGERVLLIDSDLQDPPELLGAMMAAMDAGAHVVYGQRAGRQAETRFKRASASLFYRLLGAMSDIAIPRDTGDFRLMTRNVVKVLAAMPERQRFIRGMVSWVGGRQVALRYQRQPRHAGRTGYPLLRMLRLALDALTSFSSLPLRLSLYCGFGASAIALLLLLFTLRAWARGDTVAGWSSLMTAVIFFGGIQMAFLGILGEYVGRIFQEVKARPIFLVETVLTGRDRAGPPPQFGSLDAPPREAARRSVMESSVSAGRNASAVRSSGAPSR